MTVAHAAVVVEAAAAVAAAAASRPKKKKTDERYSWACPTARYPSHSFHV